MTDETARPVPAAEPRSVESLTAAIESLVPGGPGITFAVPAADEDRERQWEDLIVDLMARFPDRSGFRQIVTDHRERIERAGVSPSTGDAEAGERLLNHIGRLAGNPLNLPMEVVKPLLDDTRAALRSPSTGDLNAAEAHWHKRATLAEAALAAHPSTGDDRLREAAQAVMESADAHEVYIPSEASLDALRAALATPAPKPEEPA